LLQFDFVWVGFRHEYRVEGDVSQQGVVQVEQRVLILNVSQCDISRPFGVFLVVAANYSIIVHLLDHLVVHGNFRGSVRSFLLAIGRVIVVHRGEFEDVELEKYFNAAHKPQHREHGQWFGLHISHCIGLRVVGGTRFD